MATNIIGADSFDTVQKPDNGEPADASDLLVTSLQPLVNRDTHLQAQIRRAIFAGKVSTGTYGGGSADPLVFTERYDPLSAFTVGGGGSGGVSLPATAWYRIDFFLKASKGSTGGLQIEIADADAVSHNLYSDTGNSGDVWIAHAGVYRLAYSFDPMVWYTGTLTVSNDSSVIITQLPDYA